MAIQTVAVTGGSGRIGSAVIQQFNDHGYATVNLNRGKKRQRVIEDTSEGADHYCRTQMLDPGKVYGALGKYDVDAVVHLATIPNPLNNVGYETYQSNVMSTYFILEAAMELEIESVCVPSSINVMGSAFQEEKMDVQYLPVDEDHPVTPRDPYALSKHAIEITADGFGRLNSPPHSISSIRYPWVAIDEELRQVIADADRSLDTLTSGDADFARDDLFSYIHVDDAAEFACRAIEADFDGHERFWVVADDTTAKVPTQQLVETCYPEAEHRVSFNENEKLVDTSKAQERTGWRPQYSWRDL